MTLILTAAVSVMMFITGWYAMPHALVMSAGDCRSETTLIYDEPTRVVVSHAHWFTHRSAREHFYLAHLTVAPDEGEAETVLVNRNVETGRRVADSGFDVTTSRAFRIAGPEVSDPHWGRYIDPLAEKGFHAKVYLFRTADGRIITGYRNLPIATCLRSG